MTPAVAAAIDPVPSALAGVWQRSLIEGAGIERDTRSTVLWLQTPSWHADLRIPPDRPDFSRCHRLDDCSGDQLRWLARQQGFAGITEVRREGSDTLCEWHRRIDLQPARGRPDIGRLVFGADGNVLEEYGVGADYHETWRRLPGSGSESLGWQRLGQQRELLLVAGAYFFFVCDRRPASHPPQDAPRLADLLERGAATAAELLDLELSFGRRALGTAGWTIEHSTLPWREGSTLDLGGEWGAIENSLALVGT